MCKCKRTCFDTKLRGVILLAREIWKSKERANGFNPDGPIPIDWIVEKVLLLGLRIIGEQTVVLVGEEEKKILEIASQVGLKSQDNRTLSQLDKPDCKESATWIVKKIKEMGRDEESLILTSFIEPLKLSYLNQAN